MSSGLVDPNDPPLPEAERRAAVLRDLLRQSGWKVTAEVADAALAQLGIPRSTLFRAVARFRRTRRASSLLPLKRGTRDGSLLLDPRIERIIEEQIERFWLKKEKPRFSALMERVHDACHVEGLRAPHRKTIKRRVVDLNPLAAARRRGQGGFGGGVYPKPRPICRGPSQRDMANRPHDCRYCRRRRAISAANWAACADDRDRRLHSNGRRISPRP